MKVNCLVFLTIKHTSVTSNLLYFPVILLFDWALSYLFGFLLDYLYLAVLSSLFYQSCCFMSHALTENHLLLWLCAHTANLLTHSWGMISQSESELWEKDKLLDGFISVAAAQANYISCVQSFTLAVPAERSPTSPMSLVGPCKLPWVASTRTKHCTSWPTRNALFWLEPLGEVWQRRSKTILRLKEKYRQNLKYWMLKKT